MGVTEGLPRRMRAKDVRSTDLGSSVDKLHLNGKQSSHLAKERANAAMMWNRFKGRGYVEID